MLYLMIMFHQIVGKGLQIRQWMKDLVDKATDKLSKYFPHLPPDGKFIRVTIGRDVVKRYKVRLQVSLPKRILFAQEQGDKLRTTVNEAADEMRRQLKRYRDRLRRFKK
ncbi:hypothetical protein A2160_00160 [Candidatus Beckwithbacteria bacterium RBG_13_42_9]|uniref:Ribosomal subunit interface protein n=1 Tax=Candidatus Beckwithbacteria bacterium RBG_13_42_9 TaxID=1797457 RepID=A0A1F5E586_9BACT|nr:MAG: hypothetical protein A2160_00160 [Candidatus Beckwithbacteria bacterium RBG_13_42_9]